MTEGPGIAVVDLRGVLIRQINDTLRPLQMEMGRRQEVARLATDACMQVLAVNEDALRRAVLTMSPDPEAPRPAPDNSWITMDDLSGAKSVDKPVDGLANPRAETITDRHESDAVGHTATPDPLADLPQPPWGPGPHTLNVTQAAQLLGVHRNTIRNMADDGRLPCRRLPLSGYCRFRREDVEAFLLEPRRGYSDLHITTDEIPRTSISNLPFGIEVHCNRVSGWQMRDYNQMIPPRLARALLPPDPKLLGGEYDRDPDTGKGGLRLDVAGFVICDSLAMRGDPDV